MRDTMAHRGPDDAGLVLLDEGRVGLGHRRLSIVDLSSAGHQPMANEDGTVWISYNGEVYNHAELRRSLETKGHVFCSRTDTEVLVHLYESRGADMVRQLRGMFALAIWDDSRKTLLLVRDRLGIKPLYYADTPEGLVFASEIKSLFASGMIRPSMDESRLPEYLNFGRVLPPRTLFRGVAKLEPGHLLEYGPDGVTRIRRYWDVFDGVERTEPEAWQDEEILERLENALRESVRLRLMSDVPVGVFLSAGVDSSTIAALVAEVKGVPLKTFTVGFEGSTVHNEVEEARSLARQLGAEHYDVTVGPTDAKQFFPDYLRYMEEPVSNPTWMAVYFVSRLAREHGVTVALSGDGGDELFVGYDKWMKILRLHKYGWSTFQHLPRSVRRGLALPARPLVRGRVGGDILRAAAAGEELFQGGVLFRREEVSRLVSADLVDGEDWRSSYTLIAEHRDSYERCAPDPSDYADWMTYLSLKSGLLEDYLMRLDKMGMAASVEGRVPFLDHELVMLAMSVPGSRKYAGWRRKWLLREVARQLLPSQLVDAPKRGFNSPVEAWVTGDFADMLSDAVSSFADDTGTLTATGVRELKQSIQPGPGRAAGMWGLMSLALWHSRWVS